MRKWMIGALALAFAMPVFAANLEFKGIKVGMQLAELKTMFPNLACDDDKAQVTTCSEEHGDGDGQEVYIFNMYQGKVARANIWISANKYRETRETLMRQLGRPSSKIENEVNKKKVEVLTWMRSAPSGMLVLEQSVANDPSKTNIMMNDDTLVGEMAKAK